MADHEGEREPRGPSKITIRIDPAMKQQLSIRLAQDGKKLQGLIKELIEEYLRRQEGRSGTS